MNSSLSKKYISLILLLSVAGLIISTLLIKQHYAVAQHGFEKKSFCAISDFVDCDVVVASEYSKFMGIPTAELAFLFFLFILGAGAWSLVSDKEKSRCLDFLLPLLLWGFAYALVMAYVSLFELRALCLFCVSLYGIITAQLVLVLLALRVSPLQIPSFLIRYGTGAIKKGDANSGLGVHLASFGTLLLVGIFFFYGLNGPVHGEASPLNQDRALKIFHQEPVLKIRVPEGRPQRGDPHSKVTIVSFSDFQCPHCKHFAFSAKPLLGKYRDQVNLVFINYPLFGPCNPKSGHPEMVTRCMAAKAGACANQQGAFWDYHELIFENQNRLSYDRFLRFAKKLGLDEQRFGQCLASDEADRLVAEDVALGQELGINETPAIFINGRRLRQWNNIELVQTLVAEELKQSN